MNIILILISSLLYVASFPSWNYWWLSFIALVPLFAAIEGRLKIPSPPAGEGWGEGVKGLESFLHPLPTSPVKGEELNQESPIKGEELNKNFPIKERELNKNSPVNGEGLNQNSPGNGEREIKSDSIQEQGEKGFHIRQTWLMLQYGALWSLAVSIGLGYWLFPALHDNYGVALPKTILFFSLCVFLPLALLIIGFMASYLFLHRRHLIFYAVVVPSIWTLMEYIKEVMPVLIPWGEIGYASIYFQSFVQIADMIGVHGVTFIIAAINSLVFFMGRQIFQIISDNIHTGKLQVNSGRSQWLQTTASMFIIGLFFLIPFVYGKTRLQTLHHEIDLKKDQGLAMDVLLVQGNFNPVERWSGMGFYHRLQKYLEMTGSGGKEDKKRVIVWPETVLNSTTKLDDSLFAEIMKYIGVGALLISGGLKEDGVTGGVLNSAYLISGTGQLMRYDKHILLPYAETSPLIDLLDPYYTAPNHFQPGVSPVSFQTDHGCVGVSICFEIVYPDFIRKSVDRGAEFLVNISNDAWFGRSSMPYTHLNAARLRAIENRRYVLRTSNSGISALIAPDGKVLSQSSLFESETVTGQFLKLNEISAYSRFGNVILYLSALFLIAGLLRIMIKTA